MHSSLASSLEFKVTSSGGSSDCTPQVLEGSRPKHMWKRYRRLRRIASGLGRKNELVTLSARTRRCARSGTRGWPCCEILTSYILKQSVVDAIVVYDADQGSGGPLPISSCSAVIDGRYDAVCGNGIIARPQDVYPPRLLALVDFEDQPPVSSSRRRRALQPKPTVCMIVAGGVASCLGGLAFTTAIFR